MKRIAVRVTLLCSLAFPLALMACGDDSASPPRFPALELEDAYSLLRSGTAFIPLCLGVEGVLSAQTLAYREILDHERADEHFKALLDSEQTPGRLYGLMGLYFTDPDSFSTEIPAYLDSEEPLPMWVGNALISGETSLVAAGIASGELPVSFRDDVCPEVVGRGTLVFFHRTVNTRSSIRIMMEIDDPVPEGYFERLLFEEPLYTESTPLETRFATRVSDVEFGDIARLLTNGERNTVWLKIANENIGGGSGRGDWEQRVFELDSTDFKGRRIRRIDMELMELNFTTPGTLGGTDIFVKAEITIWASPEGSPIKSK